jgi:predicted AlkP superfamily phosphohydrolase/phosphomutase
MHSFDNACLFVDDPDVRVGDTDLYDIGPTLLDLLNLEYNKTEFDGKSLLQRS